MALWDDLMAVGKLYLLVLMLGIIMILSSLTFSRNVTKKVPLDLGISVELFNYTVKESILVENKNNRTVNETIYIAIPQNSTHQISYMISFIPAPMMIRDNNNNTMAYLSFTMGPRERRWINSTFRVVVKSYKINFDYSIARWPNLDMAEKYTGRTLYWDTYNSTLIEFLESIAKGDDNPVSISRKIAEKLAPMIDYVPLPVRLGSDRSLIYEGGRIMLRGDCSEVADVYITLARIAGIPARMAFGFLLENMSRTVYWMNETKENITEALPHWGGHAWSQVYLGPWGWVDVELLEGFKPKLGDYSWRHIIYGTESTKFSGSELENFVLPSFSDAIYVRFEFIGEG
ncbi:MAG: hypothetical protein C0200_02080 [Thermoproteota archaeon]|nr:MAG: hypothetical protein C0200_02080 [Candidatus Korarchaeota archaeon]